MSCKVFRKDDTAALAVRVWRPSSDAIPFVEPAPGASAAGLDEAHEIEARVKAAYQQGHAAAESSAARDAAQRVEPVIAAWNRLLQDLAGTRRKFRAEVEQDSVTLAIAIARRVLHRELSTDPEAILGLILAAFQKLNARETHRLRLAPADAALLEQNRARLEIPPGLEISPDPSLPAGSAIFETTRGELDASIDTQLAEIDRGFADIMRRRAQ